VPLAYALLGMSEHWIFATGVLGAAYSAVRFRIRNVRILLEVAVWVSILAGVVLPYFQREYRIGVHWLCMAAWYWCQNARETVLWLTKHLSAKFRF
jgi:hypothetical protein